MKKTILFACLLFFHLGFSQYLGVNTTTPKSTLDITAKDPTYLHKFKLKEKKSHEQMLVKRSFF